MNKFHKNILVGLAVIGMGSASFMAQAQKDGDVSAPGQKNGHGLHDGHDGKWQERMKEQRAKRQAALHDKLKLSAGQEAAWKTYIATATPSGHGKHREPAEWAKLSAPERADKMLAMVKEREAHMTAHVAAMKTFYATLTPEQQKTFDASFMHGGGRHRGGHGGHGPTGK